MAGSGTVKHADADTLLLALEPGSVAAIITSPPYSGLPGRGDTADALRILGRHTPSVLAPGGSLILTIGATDERPFLPFADIPGIVAAASDEDLVPVAWYVWERPPMMARQLNGMTTVTDFVFQFGDEDTQPIGTATHVRSEALGFDYGTGVTMPPDIAGLLVASSSEEGDLIVDPFCGLGEIGVQAVVQGRRFIGCDLDPNVADIAERRVAARSA